jgi:hypothetical protein
LKQSNQNSRKNDASTRKALAGPPFFQADAR